MQISYRKEEHTITDRTIIGQRIAELRKQKGLTQAELADMLGVTHQAVSQWERSETLPDILTLPRIAEIFGENINAILGLEETKSVPEESPAPEPEVQETEEQPEPESAEAAFPDEEDEKTEEEPDDLPQDADPGDDPDRGDGPDGVDLPLPPETPTGQEPPLNSEDMRRQMEEAAEEARRRQEAMKESLQDKAAEYRRLA